MQLVLQKPLAFFDLETTGTNVATDRIIEICILKVNINGTKENFFYRINPGIPIPKEATSVHGITDQNVKEEKSFKDIAKGLKECLKDCDLAGYNSNRFDIPLLMEEFLRAKIDFDIENRKLVDVQNIFHQMEPRTLKAAYKFYCDKNLDQAHSAEADTEATYKILVKQLERYDGATFEYKQGKSIKPFTGIVADLHTFSNLHQTVDFAGRMIYNQAGEIVFNFGKHKGKPVFEIFEQEPSYYHWMQQGDFPLYTKKKLEQLYQQHANTKKDKK